MHHSRIAAVAAIGWNAATLLLIINQYNFRISQPVALVKNAVARGMARALLPVSRAGRIAARR
jgi:hypothetical protein